MTIQNSRGIDVPGGHIEVGETIEQAIIREIFEEAGAAVSNIRIFEELQTRAGKYNGKNMIFVTGKVLSFDKKKAKFLPIVSFLKLYTQNKRMMRVILKKAKCV